MNRPVPILLYGDSPDLPGGLSRILRDIANHVVTMPEFRVGVLGRGGHGGPFPYPVWNFDPSHQWGEDLILSVWSEFSEREPGIIMSVWDATRLDWFAMPQYLPDVAGELKRFLTTAAIERWGYFPLDATGPNNLLPTLTRSVIRRYDRILAYGLWGQEQIQLSTGRQDVDWLPHGIDLNVFQPRDRKAARFRLGVDSRDLLVGMVATNQARKNWALAFQIIRDLAAPIRELTGQNLRFWVHTDDRKRYWDFDALVQDFQVEPIMTADCTDEEMSYLYSAADLTILASGGEGFGYPIVESLACGVPVIHGKYAGGAELIPENDWLVEPYAFRFDTRHNLKRPVYLSSDWVAAISKLVASGWSPDGCRQSVSHLDWGLLWPSCWEKWFKTGLEGFRAKYYGNQTEAGEGQTEDGEGRG